MTRGSTFLGAVARLEGAYAGIVIRCFALVRSVGEEEVASMLDPIAGTIRYEESRGVLTRSP